MSKYTYSQNDAWTWRPAIHTDVEAILDLVDQNYSQEIQGIFTPNRTRMAYHLHDAILDQSYRLNKGNLTVAEDKATKQIIAWAWIVRGRYQVYADEEMAVAEFAHVDLALSARTKLTLVAQMLEQWIAWAHLHNIPVLSSTSIREDQAGFMRLHDQFGFTRRGSFAYKRIV